MRLPLVSGTSFLISQGTFGKDTHDEPGNEYNWDFDVPYGTQIVSIQDGTVLDVWEPPGNGGCDGSLCDTAHNIKIQHSDGTVAQYVHVKSFVEMGQHLKKGKVIGVTDNSGCICRPQLHFGVYQSVQQLYNSPDRKTIPLLFIGVGDGILKTNHRYLAR